MTKTYQIKFTTAYSETRVVSVSAHSTIDALRKAGCECRTGEHIASVKEVD